MNLEDFEIKFKVFMDVFCCWVIIDGVFSMEGDVVKLLELIDFCECYEVLFVVDDLYGIGVFGDFGWGMFEFFEFLGKIDLIIGIFGKVLGGVVGGYIGVF